MNSIVDQIFGIVEKGGDSSIYSIARELFEFYSNSQIPDIKELAQKCYVSQPSITRFSQLLGCSGYRELSLKLKIEIQDRKNIKENIVSDESDLFDLTQILFNDAFNFVNKYKTNIKSIGQNIKNGKRIFIFSTYVFYPEANFLKDSLIRKNCNVAFIEIVLYATDLIKVINKEDYIIFLVGGQDTKTIEYIYNTIKSQNLNHCVFITHSKNTKFQDTEDKVLIDSPLLPHTPGVRKVLLNYLILQTLLQIV